MPIQTNFINDCYDAIRITIEDPHRVMNQYNVTDRDIINLVGGVPLPTITNIRVIISSQYQESLLVKMNTDQFEVIRRIDFDIGRINNSYMRVYKEYKGMHIGTHLFLNQIQVARQYGFEKINVIAAAPDEGDEDWHGYYFWADLGFENTEPDLYMEWARVNNRTEPTLNHLMQSQDGRDAWRKARIHWIADFHLTEGHTCWFFLQESLDRKGIDWQM